MRYNSGRGSVSDRVERAFESVIGVRHCLAVNSGSSALICALVGAGIGPGDEVLVPAYTWVATAAAAIAVGAVPVLVEIDETLTIDPADIERKITPRTRAIIPVHMINLVCDMDSIMDIAARHDLIVIEDAAQAVGVSYRGRRVGSIGHAGILSFNQHKNVTCGEGGAVLTNDDRIYARALMYHDVGSYIRTTNLKHDEPIFVGQNMRISELQAGVLRPQIQRLDRLLRRRRAQRNAVVAALANVPPGFMISPHHDVDNAVGLSVIFPRAEQARTFGRTRGAVQLIDTHRHVFVNWEPIMARRTHHPASNPFLSAHSNVQYGPDQCPRTLDILTRTCSITLVPHLPTVVVRLLAVRLARRASRALRTPPPGRAPATCGRSTHGRSVDEDDVDVGDDDFVGTLEFDGVGAGSEFAEGNGDGDGAPAGSIGEGPSHGVPRPAVDAYGGNRGAVVPEVEGDVGLAGGVFPVDAVDVE